MSGRRTGKRERGLSLRIGKGIKTFFCVFALTLAARFAVATSALWFCVLGNEEIQEDGIARWEVVDWVADNEQSGTEVAFRIRVTGDGEESYLPLFYEYQDEDTGAFVTDTATETMLASAILPMNYQQASVDGYSSSATPYSVSIELGTINPDTDEFVTFARTEEATLAALSPYLSAGGTSTPPGLVWNPRVYIVVPEPMTAGLLLAGCALLALRRRPAGARA